MQNKKLAIFIPGRLASERLPNKLVLPFGGTNLWNEACKKLAALPDKYEKIAFCADPELVDIAKLYPSLRVLQRSPETLTIDGPNSEIYKDMKDLDATHLMYLHPCFAFVSIDNIIKAIEYFESHDEIDYMTSVRPFKNWLYHGQEQIIEIDEDSWSTKTVQDYWLPTHNFFMFKKDEFFETSNYLPKGHSVFPMTEEDAIDVNTLEEFQFVKWRYENASRRNR
jgi:CMP-N-acetylneuraminic acid synthetase